MKPDNKARYTIRIENYLKAKAKESALSHRWSFNTWVGVAIEEKLRNEGRLPEPQKQ